MNRESYTLYYYNGKKHIDLAKRLGDEKDYGFLKQVTFSKDLNITDEEFIDFLNTD